MKDLFFPISKKIMFRNYRFVTAENILNAITESTFLRSSGMLFQSRTTDGRKEL